MSLFFFLLIILICLFITNVYAENKIIKIFMKEMDMPKTISRDMLDKFKNQINDFFKKETENNEKLKNFEIDIYYYPYTPVTLNTHSMVLGYIKDLVLKLQKKSMIWQ